MTAERDETRRDVCGKDAFDLRHAKRNKDCKCMGRRAHPNLTGSGKKARKKRGNCAGEKGNSTRARTAADKDHKRLVRETRTPGMERRGIKRQRTEQHTNGETPRRNNEQRGKVKPTLREGEREREGSGGAKRRRATPERTKEGTNRKSRKRKARTQQRNRKMDEKTSKIKRMKHNP
ncbi:hypothetical protein TRVL_08394 [Trypanosoma vivax]|nr:hypothetical protein TRVL_08394 [Trypanosoma vivax]